MDQSDLLAMPVMFFFQPTPSSHPPEGDALAYLVLVPLRLPAAALEGHCHELTEPTNFHCAQMVKRAGLALLLG